MNSCPAPLTTAELAAALQVTPATVSGWVRAGMVPCSQIGRRRYFDLSDVLAATHRGVAPAPVSIRPRTADTERRLEGYHATFGRGNAARLHDKKKRA